MADPALHVHAITDRPDAPLPDVPGLADAPLCAVRHDGLEAVCSWASGVEPTPQELWRHEAVAEALMEDRAVLPARFGLAFSSEALLESELARRRDALLAALSRVAGRVELGLRVLEEAEREAAPLQEEGGSGRAYLSARLEERRRAERVAAEVHEPLDRLADASRKRVLQTERLTLSAAYLVRRERVDEFRAAVDRLAADRPGLRLLCTGPWPPYSFASLDEDAG